MKESYNTPLLHPTLLLLLLLLLLVFLQGHTHTHTRRYEIQVFFFCKGEWVGGWVGG